MNIVLYAIESAGTTSAPPRPTNEQNPGSVRQFNINTEAANDSPVAASGIGKFPVRLTSVTAEVLADLLEGRGLTAIESVRGSSTTRLAPKVHRLRVDGWDIETLEMQVHTLDGRKTFVAEYRMPQSVIRAAEAVGGSAFIAGVRAARARQRMDAEHGNSLASSVG